VPTGDFTIGTWIMVDSLDTYRQFLQQYASAQTGRMIIDVTTDGALRCRIGTDLITSTAGVIVVNN